jgi:hypothetical protein
VVLINSFHPQRAWRLLRCAADLYLGTMEYSEDPKPLTPVRLTRKYADAIDGVDLSHHKVGDYLNLSSRDARMLIAEGWASPCDDVRAEAADEGHPEKQSE